MHNRTRPNIFFWPNNVIYCIYMDLVVSHSSREPWKSAMHGLNAKIRPNLYVWWWYNFLIGLHLYILCWHILWPVAPIHLQLNQKCLSPRILVARWTSLGMIVTRLAWMAHKLVSSKSPTRYASAASCKASTAWLWKRKSLCIQSHQVMEQYIYKNSMEKNAISI